MCINDHDGAAMTSLAKCEFGVRPILHGPDLGLDGEQMDALRVLAKDWKSRYIVLAVEIVALGKEIDGELCRHSVNVSRVQALATRRREIIAQMESEYIELWARGNRVLGTQQFEGLLRIYVGEFERMPHPILGTDASETRDDLLGDLLSSRRPASAVS